MKIKAKINDKPSYGWWNRKFRGNFEIALSSGQKRKFRTVELYNYAKEMLSKGIFKTQLDLVDLLKKLPTGFETDQSVIPMGTGVSLPNGLFIPAKRDSIVWDD